MRAWLALALPPALLAAHALPARADCASPGIAIAPRDGATVPANPVLHLFVPAYYAKGLSAEVDGAEVSLERVATNPAFITFRVGVAAERDFTLVYKSGSLPETKVAYRVDRGWKRPSSRPVALHSKNRVENHWTCSHTDIWSLEVTDAPAYRVEWARTRAAWHAGDRTTLVVPHRTGDFWLYGDNKAETGRGQVDLGHLNCFDYTIPQEALRGRLYVSVVGLYSDGTTSPEWSEPVLLGEPEETTPVVETTEVVEPPPVVVAPPAPPVAVASPTPAGWWLAALAAGIPLLVLLAALLRRRRAAAARLTRHLD